MPLREHLKSIHRQTGVMPRLLADAPKLPAGSAHVWQHFIALHNSRGFGPAAPLRISFQDIDAYQRVQCTMLEAWEINAIRAADGAYMDHRAKVAKK